ncbi:TlpA disulfide reductase family protein [Chryseobacterium tructae]|uniref:TlpA family protein disulfide reductase n=1 Tax=Chryseobacterium tructae TaxID=1037380 RepID=A0ABV7XZN6_9FLAO|nr:TlpA disulfide reductase family protein [Chryseobacterium tructae]MDN3693441.1 TlpA disulfide reductase family protein [Chryseobacterium tructae]
MISSFALSQEIVENQALPDFSILTEKGLLKSSDLKGKVVLINFFATWCGPCLQELPHLQSEVWDKYKNNSQFSLLVIGREHSQREIEAFKIKKGYNLPMYADEKRSVYSLFAKEYIPRNYIINKEGKVVYTSVSYDEEEFKNMLNKLTELLK